MEVIRILSGRLLREVLDDPKERLLSGIKFVDKLEKILSSSSIKTSSLGGKKHKFTSVKMSSVFSNED